MPLTIQEEQNPHSCSTQIKNATRYKKRIGFSRNTAPATNTHQL